MRRLPILLFAAGAAAALAACGGSDDPEPTATPTGAAATVATPSPTAQAGNPSTPTPTIDAATATPSAAPETPSTAPSTAQATAAPATVPPAPTATPPPAGNPLAATMGVIGTGRYFWSPNSVKVAPGGVVTFTWGGGAVHDVSVPGVGFQSDIVKDATYPVTFPSAGSFAVICTIHDTMKGTVTVQ
jgi:plastocyanin